MLREASIELANRGFACSMGDATSQRPHILFPFYVEHLVVRDLTLRRSPWWTVHILACKDVLLSNIYIDAEVAFDSTVYPTDNVDGCVAVIFCAIVCCELYST